MIKVGIIMGSDSDLPVMSLAAQFLDEFDIANEILIVSAHRTPQRLVDYATTAQERGLHVIIAGAGGAAHLAGMVASFTTLPVIGVPIHTRTLNGIDSLLSIVQMPAGVPVATVAINGGLNAGILAAQILGSFDETLCQKLAAYKQHLCNHVTEKSNELENIGCKEYLLKNVVKN